MTILRAFSEDEAGQAKVLLAGKVASMGGRKFEEGDWSEVYCRAKGIEERGWSNLGIDIDDRGLGVEFKMLRVSPEAPGNITEVCGQRLMHPSATRSIRIEDANRPADDVMRSVLQQYRELLEDRTAQVQKGSQARVADMRFGWLLWESSLTELLYFETPMHKPEPQAYHAEWHTRASRGARKPSRSLWIYDNETGEKQFSVTTSAGIKIQPYFDVPKENDPNLVHFRVQSEKVADDAVILWVTRGTAERLTRELGSIEKEVVSASILAEAGQLAGRRMVATRHDRLGVPIEMSVSAHEALTRGWEGISDDARVERFLRGLGPKGR